MMYVVLDHADAKSPVKSSESAAGLDLSSVESVDILPGKRALISTGLKITVPIGTYGRIAPRSGIAWKSGIDVLAGVIDADYTGVVKVILLNTDANETYRVNVGDRIAQLVLEKIIEDVHVCVCDTLPHVFGVRGDGGFGSTGV